MRLRVFADVSALSTVIDTSSDARMYAQQCADAANASMHSQMCSRKRSHLHISAALPEHMITFCSSSRRMAGGKGRAAGCHVGNWNIK